MERYVIIKQTLTNVEKQRFFEHAVMAGNNYYFSFAQTQRQETGSYR
jgi:hypothetical protein